MRVSHRRDRFVDMIENHHPIIKGETDVGELAVVFGSIRQVFDIADHVVAGIAHGTSAKSRQPWKVGSAVSSQFLFQQLQRVGMLQFAGLRHSRTCRGSQISRWRLLDQYSSVKGLKSQKRSRAEEAVAAQPLATDHALKKK